ncbi:hypothetical protein NHJ13051_007250 [Beauveria bassiana]
MAIFAKKSLRRRIVVIGNRSCGKTCLLSVFALGFFPKHHPPSIFDDYIIDCKDDDQSAEIALKEVRIYNFQQSIQVLHRIEADVILLAFSIDDPNALQNITSNMIHERKSGNIGPPCVLVGLKKDLRTLVEVTDGSLDRTKNFVSSKQGAMAAAEIGASYYMECSSASGECVQDVFSRAAELAFPARNETDPGILDKVVRRLLRPLQGFRSQ